MNRLNLTDPGSQRAPTSAGIRLAAGATPLAATEAKRDTSAKAVVDRIMNAPDMTRARLQRNLREAQETGDPVAIVKAQVALMSDADRKVFFAKLDASIKADEAAKAQRVVDQIVAEQRARAARAEAKRQAARDAELAAAQRMDEIQNSWAEAHAKSRARRGEGA